MDEKKRKELLEKLEAIRHSRVIVYFSYTPLDDRILVPLYRELSNIVGKQKK